MNKWTRAGLGLLILFVVPISNLYAQEAADVKAASPLIPLNAPNPGLQQHLDLKNDLVAVRRRMEQRAIMPFELLTTLHPTPAGPIGNAVKLAVNSEGLVTLTFQPGQSNQRSYIGTFDRQNLQITFFIDHRTEYRFTLERNLAGDYIVKRLVTSDSQDGSSEVYNFDKRGLVKNYVDTTGTSRRTKTYSYVRVNGEYRLSKGTESYAGPSYTGQTFQSQSKMFYLYDDSGNLTSQLWINREIRNGQTRFWAGYRLREGEVTTEANAYTMTNKVFNSTRSFSDYWKIDRFANSKTKTIVYQGPESQETAQIEYFKRGNRFIPRLVETLGETFIVRGSPDVESGETDDIPFQQTQRQGNLIIEFGFPDRYYVPSQYQNSYGLVIYDKPYGETEDGVIIAVVDYPRVQTVVLWGVTYRIVINAGLVEFIRQV